MAAKKSPVSVALFLSLNLLLFTLVTSKYLPACASNPPGCGGGGGHHHHKPPPSGSTPPGSGHTPPGSGYAPPGSGSTPPGYGYTPPGSGTTPPGSGGGGQPHCPPARCPPPSPPVHKGGKCPRDALKLGVCANLLNDLLHLVVGTPPKSPCCSLIRGLADLEAALCLCTAIKLNLLGLNLNVPLSLSLLLNYCGKKVPRGFQCP